MEIWTNSIGTFKMGRYPYDAEEAGLRAWNGADTLLVEHLRQFSPDNPKKILILNDSFGSLACAAVSAGHSVRSPEDSALTGIACRENLRANGLDPAKVTFTDPVAPMDFSLWAPDLVLMQVPKGNIILEYQLSALARSLPEGTEVCAGAMTRDVHNSTVELFERLIGPTRTSLAAHKARLIHTTLTGEKNLSAKAATGKGWPRILALDEQNLPKLELVNHAGVFSSGGHDRGSLFLLQYLAGEAKRPGAETERIVDCGCGNGLLALAAARLFPHSTLICADESFMAVESARAGFERNGMADRASFLWTDCLSGVKSESADLILCNPPFHQGQGQSQTLAIAKRMFADSRRCLKNGGKLLVVANRHLGHNRFLETLFPRVSIVRENEQFMAIEAE